MSGFSGGGGGGVTDHTLLTNIGTNLHTALDTHLAASAAVHGLPASVNVLGNRSAAGEFVQRGTGTAGTTETSFTAYYSSPAAVTFAVAFSSTPKVFAQPQNGISVHTSIGSVTTTGFDAGGFGYTGQVASHAFSWVALGA